MKSDLEFYEARAKKITEDINDLEHKSIVLSVLRLISFLFVVAGVVLGVAMEQYIFYLASVAFFFGFILMCMVHSGITHNIEYLSALYQVNNQYICRIDGDFKGLMDIALEDIIKQSDILLAQERFCGNEFIVKDHDYANDLDCFGKKSLFALFNVSETSFGRSSFADELLNAPTKERTVEELKEIQEAVKELISRIPFMQSYQATAKIGKLTKMPESLLDYAREGKKLSLATKILYRMLPFCWLFPLVILFIDVAIAKIFALTVILINLIVWTICIFKNAKYFRAVDGMSRQVSSLKVLFEKLENENFESEMMKTLVRGGAWGGALASEGLAKLENALFFAKLRSQPILALALNLILPLDWFTVDLLGKWAEENGDELYRGIKSLSKVETYMCLAQTAVITDSYCFPEFVAGDDPSDNAFVRAFDVVHPLIQRDAAVANNVLLNSNIALITGSNMSGKTTLIRTIGVNTLMSYMGAPVMARVYKCGRMRIMTSMRIVDSLEENMSTFKAELVRISSIISASKMEKPLLFLIDEIFRGTNSDDRTAGALTVLNKLSYPYICGMMTTHDYSLIDKTDKKFKSVVYYHFSEQYTDEGISFDYKLEPGISRNSNAQYLMRLVGIK